MEWNPIFRYFVICSMYNEWNTSCKLCSEKRQRSCEMLLIEPKFENNDELLLENAAQMLIKFHEWKHIVSISMMRLTAIITLLMSEFSNRIDQTNCCHIEIRFGMEFQHFW